MACLKIISKYLLNCSTFVVTLISLILAALGILVLFMTNANPNLVYIPTIILITAGFLFLTSTFASCGSISEKSFLLIAYSILMLFTFSGTIYLTIQFRTELTTSRTVIENAMDNMLDDPNQRPIYIVFEGLLKCCGTTGPDSYIERNITLSITCCPNPSFDNSGIENITDITDITTVQLCKEEDSYGGCTPIIMSWVNTVTQVIYYFLIGYIIVQSVGILSALYLIYQFRKRKDKQFEEIVYQSSHPRQPQPVQYASNSQSHLHLHAHPNRNSYSHEDFRY